MIFIQELVTLRVNGLGVPRYFKILTKKSFLPDFFTDIYEDIFT